jgi:hypothetical protein
VTDNIDLSIKKTVFKRTNIIQDVDLLSDDLNLSYFIDKELINLSEKGKKSPLVFLSDNTLLEAYSIKGKYSVTDKNIKAAIFLVNGKNEKLLPIDLNGTVDKIEDLSIKIVEKVRLYLESQNTYN